MSETGDGLHTARAALAAVDARFDAADRLLAELVASAYLLAEESISKLSALRDEIDAAVTARRTDTPAAAQEFGRFLLAKNREIAAIVTDARAEAHAKTVALQALTSHYTE